MNSISKPLIFLVSVSLFAGASVAQESPPATATDPAVNQARALLKLGRKDIIEEEIRFSEEEAAGFWPVYDSYQAYSARYDEYADLSRIE